MKGCAIRCSNTFVDEKGEEIVAPLEYETLAMMGSNLAVASLDTIAQLNYLCNDLGLDTIETGATLGVIAEPGLFDFGDGPGFLNFLRQALTPLSRCFRLIARRCSLSLSFLTSCSPACSLERLPTFASDTPPKLS